MASDEPEAISLKPKRQIHMAGLGEFNKRLAARWPDATGEVLPDEATLRAIYEYGQSYIAEEADKPSGPPLAFCSCQWPRTGPALLGMTFAYNVRHRTDELTGSELFARMWTEQGHGEIATKEQMQHDLFRYCLGHVGNPTAVS